jgi:hypothetical protein
MTRDEIKKKMVNIILTHDLYEQQIVLGQKPMTQKMTLGDCANQIFDLFEGWKSPEEVRI